MTKTIKRKTLKNRKKINKLLNAGYNLRVKDSK